MDHFQMCRSAWCEKCYQAGRPENGNYFALYKQSRDELILQEVGNRNWYGEIIPKGFSPQLFTLIMASDEGVHYTQDCLMCECGVKMSVRYTEQAQPYPEFEFIDQKTGIMPVSSWNALVFRWNMKGGGSGYEV